VKEIASQEDMEVEKEVLHSRSLDSLTISAVHLINYDFEGEVEIKQTCNEQQKHIAKWKSERIANLEEGNW
jgi:hypothetical protein